MTASTFVGMTSEDVPVWPFQRAFESGVRSAVVLRTMPTSEESRYGTPGFVALRTKIRGFFAALRMTTSKVLLRMTTSKFIA